MKKLLLLTVIALVTCVGAMAQAPEIQWQKSFGGSNYDEASYVQLTTDGGYIVAVYSESDDGDVTGHHGGFDYWIVKLDASGAMEWQKSLGGTSNDFVRSIQQTTDGGYIVVGDSYSDDGDVTGHHGSSDYSDCWIVKLDASGAIAWQKSLGGSGRDYAQSIQQTTDGGYIVAGDSYSDDGDVTGHHGSSDYWIVKLDASGAIEWEKSLGGSDYDYVSSIQQTADGGYIVAGKSSSLDDEVTGGHGGGFYYNSAGNEYWYPYSDYWIVKLDASGAIAWERSLGGSYNDAASSIQQTADGDYIVAGVSSSNDGDVTGHHGGVNYADYWIVKLDASGAIAWERSLGGVFHDEFYSLKQTSDGGYIVAGVSKSFDGDVTYHHGFSEHTDYWIVKLDASGAIEWEKALGGTIDDWVRSIQQTTDGGYIVAGNTYSNDGDVTDHHGSNDYPDYWIVKLDASGNTKWKKSLGGSNNEYLQSIQQTADGNYIVVGTSGSHDGDVTLNHEVYDIWIVKINDASGIHDMHHDASALFSLYPNPNNGHFIIEGPAGRAGYNLSISNMLGQKVYSQTEQVNGDKLLVEIAADSLTPGIYFLEIAKEGKRVAMKPFVVKSGQ